MSSLSLVRPLLTGHPLSLQALAISFSALAYHQLLEIAMRPSTNPNHRTVGTLCGPRPTNDRVHVAHVYVVPHSENDSDDEIQIELDHHRAEYALYHRLQPKHVVLGWFATSDDGGVDLTLALVHDFYAKLVQEHGSAGALPIPAVHVTLATGTADLQGYVASPVGSGRGGTNYAFAPVAVKVDGGVGAGSGDVAGVKEGVRELTRLIEQQEAYVQGVLAGGEGDPALGWRMLQGLATTEQAVAGWEKHVDDLLMVEHLSGVVKQQMELSATLMRMA